MTKSSSDHGFDAIVVGGGTAGLSAALMLGRSRRNVLVLDSERPRNRFAAHMHGVVGNENTPPLEFLARGREEAANYQVQFASANVTRVVDASDALKIESSTGNSYRTRVLILATGCTDNLPDVPGLAEHWGSRVLHCPYCHGWEVAGQRLGVLATSELSLHQAQMVRQLSENVTLFSSPIEPIDQSIVSRLRSRGIRIVSQPVTAIADAGSDSLAVRTADGKQTLLDALFVATDPTPNDSLLETMSLVRRQSPIGQGTLLQVDPSGRTSHPRIWAAGNIVDPMLNVPGAMGAGAMAGAAANGALVIEDFDNAMERTK